MNKIKDRNLRGLERGRFYQFNCQCKRPTKMIMTKPGGGIGIRTIIKCDVCNVKKDITDYEFW